MSDGLPVIVSLPIEFRAATVSVVPGSTAAVGWYHLFATPDWLCVDRRYRVLLSGEVSERVFEVPVNAITSIEVEGIAQQGKNWDGWRLATGIVHGAKTAAPTTGIAFVIRDGTYLVVEAHGEPMQIRLALQDLSAIVNPPRPLPPHGSR